MFACSHHAQPLQRSAPAAPRVSPSSSRSPARLSKQRRAVAARAEKSGGLGAAMVGSFFDLAKLVSSAEKDGGALSEFASQIGVQ